MGQIRALGLALAVALTISGIATTMARAESEGPYIAVKNQVLGNGESREVTGTAKAPFTFKSKAAKVKVECKGLELAPGATVNGSSRETASGGKETIRFARCAGGETGEGLTGCEPEGGVLTTAPLIDTIGFANSAKTGPVLVLFEPETGSTLATVKLSGAKCVATSTTVTGHLVGEAFAAGSAVEVGKNEIQTVKPEIRFAPTEKTIWTESGGSLTSTKNTLTTFGASATFEGEAGLELASQQPFGPLPRPMFLGDAYSLTPEFLNYQRKAGLTLAFTFEDLGSSNAELEHMKIGGSDAKEWELTDTNFCTVKTFVSLGHCELTIKLLNSTAGSALLEGEVHYEGGPTEALEVKALVP
jgi:hypothetical protein